MTNPPLETHVFDSNLQRFKKPLVIRAWLLLGVILVMGQVIIGGVTRLTGSGLSITKWEVVTGTLPPMSDTAWDHEFDLYKATPQYTKINAGMSMSDFKFIYFWEYFHRLWARAMGFIFAIPFMIFCVLSVLAHYSILNKKWKLLDWPLIRRLGIVICLAMLAATFGWIMVASGLNDRPWVSAYKLSIHLSIGFSLAGMIWYTFLREQQPNKIVFSHLGFKRAFWFTFILVCVQIIFGGLMAGMKAGLLYTTWPMMGDSFIPAMIFDGSRYTLENIVEYDNADSLNPIPSLVHTIHRLLAYTCGLAVFGLTVYGFKLPTTKSLRIGLAASSGITILQIVLGIITVLTAIGSISVLWGELHQVVGLFLMYALIYVWYQTVR